MWNYVFVIPLVAAVIAVIYIVLREMTRVWLDHRVKIALLERVEHKPELLDSFQELQDLLDDRAEPVIPEHKVDLTLTGVFLALLGLGFVVVYALVGRSQWAVGAYFGGVVCIVIGFLLTTMGLLVRLLRRPPRKPE